MKTSRQWNVRRTKKVQTNNSDQKVLKKIGHSFLRLFDGLGNMLFFGIISGKANTETSLSACSLLFLGVHDT